MSIFVSWKNTNLGTSTFEFFLLLKWCPIFDSLPLIQNSKFNNFLLYKNLSNFVPPAWKLHNPYCHNIHPYFIRIWYSIYIIRTNPRIYVTAILEIFVKQQETYLWTAFWKESPQTMPKISVGKQPKNFLLEIQPHFWLWSALGLIFLSNWLTHLEQIYGTAGALPLWKSTNKKAVHILIFGLILVWHKRWLLKGQ